MLALQRAGSALKKMRQCSFAETASHRRRFLQARSLAKFVARAKIFAALSTRTQEHDTLMAVDVSVACAANRICNSGWFMS